MAKQIAPVIGGDLLSVSWFTQANDSKATFRAAGPERLDRTLRAVALLSFGSVKGGRHEIGFAVGWWRGVVESRGE